MRSIAEIIKNKNIKSDIRNKYEYQAYGNRLAEEMGDMRHRSLYIKLAKSENRALLERARQYVLSAAKITTPGKLFMWKLTELKKPPTVDIPS